MAYGKRKPVAGSPGGESMNAPSHPHLVDAAGLIAAIWEEGSRPSLRWLREQQKCRTIPFVKLGRRVWFDPEAVRSAMEKNFTLKAR